MFKKLTVASAIAALIFVEATSMALGAPNPNGTGQPSANCETSTTQPTGFSTGGFANAASNYAGSFESGSLHSGNPNAVSQYDVACYQLSSH